MAGGPSVVAKKMKLSRTTVWRWYNVGLPDTDFSGRTNHAKFLAKMCNKNGHSVDHEQILRAGKP